MSIGIAGIAAGMALSLSWDIRPGKRGWAVPLDVWMLVNGAEYVAAGALGYMYEARVGPALPLFHILLAPAAYVGYELGLTKSDPRFIAYPTMWLLVGPYAMAFAIPILAWARRLAALLAEAPRLLAVQISVGLVGVAPSFFYGHFEDGLALGLVMLSVSLRLSGRLDASALALALAISSKQWAVVALPVIALAHMPRFRPRHWVLALALPALLAGFVLAVDWRHAAPALFDAPTYPQLGRAALWLGESGTSLVTAPFRAAILVVPVVFALWLRRSRGEVALVHGVALVLWTRALFEPVLHAYYLAPALAFLVIAQLQRTSRFAATTGLAAALLLYFSLHPSEAIWWIGFYAAWLALAVPTVRAVLAVR